MAWDIRGQLLLQAVSRWIGEDVFFVLFWDIPGEVPLNRLDFGVPGGRGESEVLILADKE